MYGYYINLDERGSFYADVRDADGETVLEIHNDEEDGTIGLVEAGYMRHARDLDGLRTYMIDVLGYPASIEVLDMATFEARLDAMAAG
jgi:hypothetical protein